MKDSTIIRRLRKNKFIELVIPELEDMKRIIELVTVEFREANFHVETVYEYTFILTIVILYFSNKKLL